MVVTSEALGTCGRLAQWLALFPGNAAAGSQTHKLSSSRTTMLPSHTMSILTQSTTHKKWQVCRAKVRHIPLSHCCSCFLCSYCLLIFHLVR